MEYSSKHTTVCLSDPRKAALFFDYVFLPLGHNQVQEVDKTFFSNKLYPNLTGLNQDRSLMAEMMALEVKVAIKCGIDADSLKKGAFKGNELYDINIEQFAKLYLDNPTTPKEVFGYPISFREIVNNNNPFYKMCDLPLVLDSESLYRNKNVSYEDILITISDIPIIDTSEVSWHQILEIRKDPTAKQKLTNLKLFIFDNYQGKTKDYITDDISRKMYEYENAAKKHGFNLIASSFDILLNSKTILTTSAAAITGLVLNEPLLVGSSLITGLSFEIGRIILNITKVKHLFNEYEKEHGLSYLFHLKKKLK